MPLEQELSTYQELFSALETASNSSPAMSRSKRVVRARAHEHVLTSNFMPSMRSELNTVFVYFLRSELNTVSAFLFLV